MKSKNNSGAGPEKKIKTETKIKRNFDNSFPIVAIGASAGGLEALEEFFTNLQKDSGMAFVIIQHLDPTHVGIMPELLQRITHMNVLQAVDGIKVRPDYLYVIPPNKSMSILNGALHLFEPVESRGLRLPIDIFFRSLATDREEKSIGVILSGMGSDGSLGLKAIKEKNGLVLVQDPETAKFDSMPRSAIDAINADIVAPADKLLQRLIAFLNYTPILSKTSDHDEKSKSHLDKIIILLREHSGHDFSLYKKSTLMRRIERRKGIHQIDNIQNYVRLLQENQKEVEILFKELLIGVTSFFRDTTVWEKLSTEIFPKIIETLPEGYTLRVWIPGCSTGEEAYSMAIVFIESLEKLKKRKNISLQIFATDLDADAIDFARKGLFPANISNEISPERLNRFFSREGDKYRVRNIIRETVIFATQNVTKDPSFTHLDLISCRNMMIYMESELQKKLIALFCYSLNPGGILLLGTAETIGGQNEGFKDLDTGLKIYRRTTTNVLHDITKFPGTSSKGKKTNIINKITTVMPDNIQTLADQILLQKFSPASVLVNNQGDIIYITGRTGKYLEPIAGKANWNIYVMAREGLRQELPMAFRNAMKSYDAVKLTNIKIGNNGGNQFIDIIIQRIENPESLRDMIMVVFIDVPAIITHDEITSSSKKTKNSPKIKELELKLQRSLEDLHSSREEMQTSQEELKSTNEELQSANEELQSTNEELTTSKEEMQSLNEELQTVNAELMSKVNEFMRANDDMKNLLNSTEIATMFLDKDLNIRRYTDNLAKIIKLRPTDIGRPFTDLVSDLKYPEIDKHASNVLNSLISKETAIKTVDDRWFNVRIMPYRTIDDRIDGLVMTFSDISIAKHLELELKKINETLKLKKK